MKLNKKGFSLLEVIICLSITAILSAMAMPTFLGFVEQTNKDACLNNRRALLEEYKLNMSMSKEDDFQGFMDTLGLLNEDGENLYCQKSDCYAIHEQKNAQGHKEYVIACPCHEDEVILEVE